MPDQILSGRDSTADVAPARTAGTRLDAVCSRFEAAWQQGSRPALEEHLSQVPEPERWPLLERLVRVEFHYRQKTGETPSLKEYQSRFPQYEKELAQLLSGQQATPGDNLSTSADGTPMWSTPMWTPGRDTGPPVIPGYELMEEIGRGGMGVVYKARQRPIDRLVALKIIRGSAWMEGEGQERFRTEATALARLHHPNIIEVFEVGEAEDRPFFSMEFVEGGTLAARLRQEPPTLREAARLIEEIARALHVVHTADVLHRDLKPSNILLGAGGTPKVSDFGLARLTDREDGMTQTGVALGTPGYMAPELAAGRRDIGPGVDIYGLGATLYEMLTGRAPFKGQSQAETVSQVLNRAPTPPRQFRRDVPRVLEAICLKCLEKSPAGRYPSAADLADDLAAWRDGRSTVARPLSWPRRAWRLARRHWQVLAAGLLMAAVAALVWMLRPGQPSLPVNPPDPVTELQRKLAAGEVVTLVDKTGPPAWYRWPLGAVSLEGQDRFSPLRFQASLESLLELLPDPGIERYRLAAEIRHEANVSVDVTKTTIPAEGDVGLYFGRQTCGANGDLQVQRLTVIYFQDIYQGGIVPTHDTRVRCSQATLVHGKGVQPGLGPIEYGIIPFQPKGVKFPECWRQLAIEVSPEEVSILWADAEGLLQPAVKWSAAELTRQNKLMQTVLQKAYKANGITITPFQPRSGLGIYAKHAIINVRNVTIEPLLPTP